MPNLSEIGPTSRDFMGMMTLMMTLMMTPGHVDLGGVFKSPIAAGIILDSRMSPLPWLFPPSLPFSSFRRNQSTSQIDLSQLPSNFEGEENPMGFPTESLVWLFITIQISGIGFREEENRRNSGFVRKMVSLQILPVVPSLI
jgi:hypothetical protein